MKKILQNFTIKKSTIQGKGAFAAKPIKKGELICIMRGKRFSMKELETIYREGNKRMGVDPLQVGVRSYILLDDPYNLINHSCDPNVAIQGENKLVAIKNIREGDEIAYDYSAVEWTPQEYPPYYTGSWPMLCKCGTKTCREVVGCFNYLPKSLQNKYIKLNAVPEHILKKIKLPIEKQRCLVCEKRFQIKDKILVKK